jgi:endonuclease G
MKQSIRTFQIALLVIFSVFSSCSKLESSDAPAASDKTNVIYDIKSATVILSEGYENASKSSYTGAFVSLSSGSWYLDDALIGNSSSDQKNGTNSARIRNVGKLTMKFDLINGAGTVEVKHALYGTDASLLTVEVHGQRSVVQ